MPSGAGAIVIVVETDKILIQHSCVDNHDTNQILKLTFSGRALLFKFTNYDSIEQNERKCYKIV